MDVKEKDVSKHSKITTERDRDGETEREGEGNREGDSLTRRSRSGSLCSTLTRYQYCPQRQLKVQIFVAECAAGASAGTQHG